MFSPNNVTRTPRSTTKVANYFLSLGGLEIRGHPFFILTMTSLFFLLFSLLAVAPTTAQVKTPQTSKLFEKITDPESRAVSFRLKKGVAAPNQQGTYFVNKSMTEDGRFLLFETAPVEWGLEKVSKSHAVVDFLRDTVIALPFTSMGIPYLDTEEDKIYFGNKSGIFVINLLENPQKEIKLFPLPEEYRKEGGLKSICTHFTLSHDKTLLFVDSRFSKAHFAWGAFNLKTGKWEKWGEENEYCINHGQIHPFRNDLALCAHETGWYDKNGKRQKIKLWDGVYPRLFLMEKGKRTMIPAQNNYATHERWDEQGEGFYWCSSGVYYCDLATMKQQEVSPYGNHAMMSIDRNNVVSDDRIGSYYRGCHWRVWFWDRNASEGLYISFAMPGIGTPKEQSRIHPDPHPHFVCGDKYIVWTQMDTSRTVNLVLTPTAGLKELINNNILGKLPYDEAPAICYRKLLKLVDFKKPQGLFWQALLSICHRLGEEGEKRPFGEEYYKHLQNREDCALLGLETFLDGIGGWKTHDQWEAARNYGLDLASKDGPSTGGLLEKVMLQIDAYKISFDASYLDNAVRLSSTKAGKNLKAERLAAAAIALRYLDSTDKRFEKERKRFVSEAAALIARQGRDGLWNGNADDSACYAFALAEGIRQGWLDNGKFVPVVRKAWTSLCRIPDCGETGLAAITYLCNILI